MPTKIEGETDTSKPRKRLGMSQILGLVATPPVYE
jgi:hypothetical protein